MSEMDLDALSDAELEQLHRKVNDARYRRQRETEWKKGYQHVPFPNLRRQRADALLATIMQTLGPCLHHDSEAFYDASRALAARLMDDGVEILSDYERDRLGLPPRQINGWTAEEVRILEAKRLEALLTPPSTLTPASGHPTRS